jgi:hypothetical protein
VRIKKLVRTKAWLRNGSPASTGHAAYKSPAGVGFESVSHDVYIAERDVCVESAQRPSPAVLHLPKETDASRGLHE